MAVAVAAVAATVVVAVAAFVEAVGGDGGLAQRRLL